MNIVNRLEGGKNASAEWMLEAEKCYAICCELLKELQSLGFAYKKLSKIIFIDKETPVWQGLSLTEGYIEIDPLKHDARAIAHELGHGFDEKLGEMPGRAQKGESMAEAIRYFAEEKMGNREWSPIQNKEILEACNYNFDTFKEKLVNNEF